MVKSDRPAGGYGKISGDILEKKKAPNRKKVLNPKIPEVAKESVRKGVSVRK